MGRPGAGPPADEAGTAGSAPGVMSLSRCCCHVHPRWPCPRALRAGAFLPVSPNLGHLTHVSALAPSAAAPVSASLPVLHAALGTASKGPRRLRGNEEADKPGGEGLEAMPPRLAERAPATAAEPAVRLCPHERFLESRLPPTALHLHLLPLYPSSPLQHGTASQLWKMSARKYFSCAVRWCKTAFPSIGGGDLSWAAMAR